MRSFAKIKTSRKFPNLQYLPIHLKLPVAFPSDIKIGKVSCVVLGITSTQDQLTTCCIGGISEIFNKGITVFKIFIWGGISSVYGREFSFTTTHERSRKT